MIIIISVVWVYLIVMLSVLLYKLITTSISISYDDTDDDLLDDVNDDVDDDVDNAIDDIDDATDEADNDEGIPWTEVRDQLFTESIRPYYDKALDMCLKIAEDPSADAESRLAMIHLLVTLGYNTTKSTVSRDEDKVVQ